jgi:hypothetical protein
LKTDMLTEYFFLTSTKKQFLIVTSIKHEEADAALDTTGTLYGPMGMVAMDEDDGENNGFRLRAPIVGTSAANAYYIISVMGASPSVVGKYTVQAKSDDLSTAPSDLGMVPGRPSLPPTAPELMAGMLDFYTFEVGMPGTLQIKSLTPSTPANTPAINTYGTLYGPNGREVAADDDGADPHFQILEYLSIMGQYVLVVEGYDRTITGPYQLALNFIDVEIDTDPPTDTALLTAECEGNVECAAQLRIGYVLATDLQMACNDAGFGATQTTCMALAAYEPSVAQCANAGIPEIRTVTVGGGTRTVTRDPSASSCRSFITDAVDEYRDSLIVETDATGSLENPEHGSIGSGISVISGWVCAANEVEVRLRDAATGTVTRHQVAYGTSRRDTRDDCDGATRTGFGMTFNFNLLPEGMYTIAAYADDERIGGLNTFEVVHLSDDEYLEDVDGMCHVAEFPADGYTTQLGWQESLQNFVIENVSMDEEPAPTAAE